MKTKDRPERQIDRLVRGLGVASAGLGLPMVLRPSGVARVAGVDDIATAPALIRGVGVRELGHAGLLLLGPRRSVWTRVVGDAMDLALMGHALRSRSGDRLGRLSLATLAVAGITALDVRAALRTRGSQHGAGRPGPLALRASTTVNRPPDEAYAFWRELDRLPSFMGHLESVVENDDGTSHWVAHGPAGKQVSWDAEITSEEPGRRLSWMSLPGADVENSGTVHFAPAPGDRGTEVSVVLHYDVPGGLLGRAVATLFGEEPEQQVRDDLRRFKQVIETGEVVRTEILPRGTEAKRRFLQGPARASKVGSSR
ncbi:SRPBCC family protein [Knoellia sp. CPCC 206435]|uniref:SRPBCC family protein n=1 Tax=Knoellia terrae TaxID=3404797 RepID=UPI003B434E28